MTVSSLILVAALAGAPVQLGSPGFTGNASVLRDGQSVTDYFGNQLRLGGVKVVTAAELAAALGPEAATALSTCLSEACTAAARVPGLDGLVQGTVVHLGTAYQLDVRVLQPDTGAPLGVRSVQAHSDDELYELLKRLAKEMAIELFTRTGKEPVVQPLAQLPVERPVEASVVAPVGVALLGAAALGVGIALDVAAHNQLGNVINRTQLSTWEAAQSAAASAQRLSIAAAALIAVGGVAFLGGIGWWVGIARGNSLLVLAPWLGPDRGGVVVSARLP